ncbi:penicillin-insensitive murein endopeptidase [Amylibacter marinus]|uniref:Penicillin-insensitive murein endopeptidase n=1 Tax=Amylibacter marinus TaxID=1475483 RepID=A0ABQ5VWD1_9RHOB|nr:penicillin-insensitive murein endopeptidase [Amylibacter marinus]
MIFVAIFLGSFFHTTFAVAETRARFLLGAKTEGSHQKPQSIGFYSKGCLAGGVELAPNGPTWQAMRLSRGRNWGHPDMIDYIERVSAEVAKKTRWKGLYVGDISQPRGGPMISGHASHQMGLDADIWLLAAKNLNLTVAERESLSSANMRSGDQRSVSKNWTKQHMKVMEIAAKDRAVDRIFVTPPVKIYMCKHARGNRDWLQKIRPFWGHNYHFHVRLKCPKGDRRCETQKPTVSALSKGGDGCDETLNWWVTDALRPAKPDPNAPKPKPRKHPRQFTMADLPNKCAAVLKSK